ncbi:diguanylate cyclase [Pseudoduganella sp. SL102]|uniref:diguanylate cyclase domain-containing protein n=1 Tax=Pseudoduganella sp. SL102 TaxID=2995154 RepID=UPI00248CDE37|nr:diguanylate cyclase [Pseudoduganella sp. SL102]WBS05159.1 diguanylate cyclase [Pseudoduganella sp. SL102]
MVLYPRTLKSRIAILVGVLALASAVLASLAVLHPMRQQMRAVVGNQQAALLASTAAALDQQISDRRTLLRAVAESAAREGGLRPAGLQSLLEQHPVLRDEFDNVVVLDASGTLIANLADRRATGDRGAAKARTFRETIATREGVISPPYRSPFTGKPTIVLLEPVIGEDGSVAYVLGGALSLVNARFMGQFLASRPGSSAYFFLIDQQGTILYHPDASRVLRNVWREEGGITDTTRQALAGFEGWTEGITKEGQRALLAATHLRRTGWTLTVVYPAAEAFAPLQQGEDAAWLSAAAVTLLAAGAGLWLVSRFLRPLRRLHRQVDMLAAGTADIGVLDSARADEIGSLSRAFFGLSQQRRAAEERLALLSRTDVLTGLNNRRMFEAELPAAIARARRQHQGLVLAFLDIDRFKDINDTFGHAIGDRVLGEFADRLRRSVREVDTIARLAGDEFVIIFETIDTQARIAPIVDKLLAAIREPFACGGMMLDVTATVGVAYSTGKVAPDKLLKIADDALYEAKAAGRNTWALRHVDVAADPLKDAGPPAS